MRSMSTHRYVMVSLTPVSLFVVCSAESSVLNCIVVFFWVSCTGGARRRRRDLGFQASLRVRRAPFWSERGCARAIPDMLLDAVLAVAKQSVFRS